MKFGTDGGAEVPAAIATSDPAPPSASPSPARLRRAADKTCAKGGRRRLEINGQKIWVTDGCSPARLRPGRPTPTPTRATAGYHLLPGRRAGATEQGPLRGLNVPAKIEARLQGVESTSSSSTAPLPPSNILAARRPASTRLRADDGRARGRPRERRRARRRRRRARSSWRCATAQDRTTLRQADRRRQAIQFKLADMAAQVEAARPADAARSAPQGRRQRSDLEAGMAKLFASEAGRFCVEERCASTAATATPRSTDRAPVPRRAAAADRRGDLGDPADGHRPQLLARSKG